jgi:hypothetical protein
MIILILTDNKLLLLLPPVNPTDTIRYVSYSSIINIDTQIYVGSFENELIDIFKKVFFYFRSSKI